MEKYRDRRKTRRTVSVSYVLFYAYLGLGSELCTLTRAHVRLGKRSGTVWVLGKGNKYRELPLNATARAALLAYDPSLETPSNDPTPLFLSEKRHNQLTGRGLGYLVQKYAERAHVRNVSPHTLRHRFGYHMAASVPLHRLAQLMGHDDALCASDHI